MLTKPRFRLPILWRQKTLQGAEWPCVPCLSSTQQPSICLPLCTPGRGSAPSGLTRDIRAVHRLVRVYLSQHHDVLRVGLTEDEIAVASTHLWRKSLSNGLTSEWAQTQVLNSEAGSPDSCIPNLGRLSMATIEKHENTAGAMCYRDIYRTRAKGRPASAASGRSGMPKRSPISWRSTIAAGRTSRPQPAGRSSGSKRGSGWGRSTT
ncbi:hypothetical protein BN1047_00111 [Mycolicibacterium neoaurum]|uniref:Uncharacterized protein n=1 Tax=Mycolicibacterium neoaurum TaxID=1795 RepID=A0AAV2WD23_MYCNE|nr:hypothetical protein BN1047_00111 [Mycolicibacterium neoaurum]